MRENYDDGNAWPFKRNFDPSTFIITQEMEEDMREDDKAVNSRIRENCIKNERFKRDNPHCNEEITVRDRLYVDILITMHRVNSRFPIDEIIITKKGMIAGLEQIFDAYAVIPDNVITYADEINVMPSNSEFQYGRNHWYSQYDYDKLCVYLGIIDEGTNTGATLRHELAHAIWHSRYSNEFKDEFYNRIMKIPYSITPYAASCRNRGKNHKKYGRWSFANETHSEFMSIVNRPEIESLDGIWRDYPFNKKVFHAIYHIYVEMLGNPKWKSWDRDNGHERTPQERFYIFD